MHTYALESVCKVAVARELGIVEPKLVEVWAPRVKVHNAGVSLQSLLVRQVEWLGHVDLEKALGLGMCMCMCVSV